MSGLRPPLVPDIVAARNAETIDLLVAGARPPEPNLYTLVPCGRGRKGPKGPREALYPAPAIPADQMAAALAQWLQDEITLIADPRATSTPDPNALWDSIPVLKITEDDVVNCATHGVPFRQPEAEHAYNKWCVRLFGVRLARPDVLYGWAADEISFWALETLQEMFRVEHAVDIPEEDIARAANNEECVNSHAQLFFDGQAASDCFLTAAKNMNEHEMVAFELEGPYYRWEAAPGAPPTTTTPWDGACTASDFACRLEYAFATASIAPGIRFPETQADLRYIQHPPTAPDEAVIKRIAAGEWRTILDGHWKARIRRCPMYAWEIRTEKPGAALNISASDAELLPDPAAVFTAAEMAKDMAEHLHVDVAVADVEGIAEGTPAGSAVEAAWRAFVKIMAAAGGVVGIRQL